MSNPHYHYQDEMAGLEDSVMHTDMDDVSDFNICLSEWRWPRRLTHWHGRATGDVGYHVLITEIREKEQREREEGRRAGDPDSLRHSRGCPYACLPACLPNTSIIGLRTLSLPASPLLFLSIIIVEAQKKLILGRLIVSLRVYRQASGISFACALFENMPECLL